MKLRCLFFFLVKMFIFLCLKMCRGNFFSSSLEDAANSKYGVASAAPAAMVFLFGSIFKLFPWFPGGCHFPVSSAALLFAHQLTFFLPVPRLAGFPTSLFSVYIISCNLGLWCDGIILKELQIGLARCNFHHLCLCFPLSVYKLITHLQC